MKSPKSRLSSIPIGPVPFTPKPTHRALPVKSHKALPVKSIGEDYPIILTSSLSLTPGAESAPNSQALTNTLPVPIEIKEIAWELHAPLPSGYITFEMGGIVGCSFTYGDQRLTNGFVPVWSFGKAQNLLYESVVSAITGNECFSHYRWRLSKPIYLPPGGYIEPKFKHNGQSNATINVRVSYKGTVKAPGYKPKARFLPYVTSYSSSTFTIQSTSDTDQSHETDLLNPFDVPLTVERFVGRCMRFDNGTEITEGTQDLSDAHFLLTNMRMIRSDGYQPVREPTVFANLFNPVSRSWQVPHVLDPGQFYIAYLTRTSSIDSQLTSMYTYAQFFVSMVGYREIK